MLGLVVLGVRRWRIRLASPPLLIQVQCRRVTNLNTEIKTIMSLHYFHKLVFNSPVRVAGQIVRFEPIGNNAGVKVLADDREDQKAELAELDKLANTQARGVTRISKEIYEQKKNNLASTTSQPARKSLLDGVRIVDRDQGIVQNQAGAAKPAAVVADLAARVKGLEDAVTKAQIPVTSPEQPKPFVPNVRKVEDAPKTDKPTAANIDPKLTGQKQ